MVSSDRCNRSCNTIDDLLSRISILSKTEDVNLNVFNMITRINELKTLRKHISYDYKCKFDDKKCNSNQKWNNESYRCECKNQWKHLVCKNDNVWNSSAINRYLKSIANNLVFRRDEITDTITKFYNSMSETVSINSNHNKATCKMGYFI